MSPPAEPAAASTDALWLRQLVRPLLIACAAFAFGELVLAGLFRSVYLLHLSAILWGYLGVCLRASRLTRQGRTAAASLWLAYGLIAVCLATTWRAPFTYITLELTLLLAFSIALPYVQGRALVSLFCTCVPAALVIFVVGSRGHRPDELPAGLAFALQSSSVTAAMALILALLVATKGRSQVLLARALASEDRFRTLIRASTQILWQTDAQGRVAEPTESWLGFTGQTRDQAMGDGWFEALHPEDRGWAREEWAAALQARQVYRAQHRVRRADGTYTAMLVGAAPVLSARGEVLEWVGANTDVSALKRVELELRQAVRAREEFLGQASHELRTPLSALLLQMESLQHWLSPQADGPLPPERGRQKLEIMDRQLRRLCTLVDALLDVSRIDEGRLSLAREPVELTRRVHDTLELLREQVESSGCAVEVRADGEITGEWDRLRLEQILTNLVSNALKYGRGKPVRVELSTTPDGGAAVIQVIDHGIGISPEDQARIFERFERAASPQHFPGIGLGLWIVRALVGAHGGTLRVDSEPGRGATFTVQLPRRLPARP